MEHVFSFTAEVDKTVLIRKGRYTKKFYAEVKELLKAGYSYNDISFSLNGNGHKPPRSNRFTPEKVEMAMHLHSHSDIVEILVNHSEKEGICSSLRSLILAESTYLAATIAYQESVALDTRLLKNLLGD